MRFGLTTDFRNFPGSGKSSATVYAETIDLFAWAETLGFGAAYVFEHHFTDDDYMSSPMVAATAIAARTKQMRIGPDIAILPLYDPVRVAEDGAVLDLISNGRLDFGAGLGYRPEEYAGYGLDIKSKGSRANEALEIIRRLSQGKTVSFQGTHFNIDHAKLSLVQSSSQTRRSGSAASARPRPGVPRGTAMAISDRQTVRCTTCISPRSKPPARVLRAPA